MVKTLLTVTHMVVAFIRLPWHVDISAHHCEILSFFKQLNHEENMCKYGFSVNISFCLRCAKKGCSSIQHSTSGE